ncbi:hypothetical protein AYI68_g2500 [Smittium mucronatum]|uniref:Uncharacterized protein n=1 Tax=Smittium mucronatum TaxID=133383 RepID=A0A1R0H2M8_9FUNG|nr:hypothetical protein AYI68_g2500 [Smittium mucronatum]
MLSTILVILAKRTNSGIYHVAFMIFCILSTFANIYVSDSFDRRQLVYHGQDELLEKGETVYRLLLLL